MSPLSKIGNRNAGERMKRGHRLLPESMLRLELMPVRVIEAFAYLLQGAVT